MDDYVVKWDIRWVNQDAAWMRVKCKDENRYQMLFAFKVDLGDDFLVIKTMEPQYTCVQTFYHQRATLAFLVGKYVDKKKLENM